MCHQAIAKLLSKHTCQIYYASLVRINIIGIFLKITSRIMLNEYEAQAHSKAKYCAYFHVRNVFNFFIQGL